MRALPILVLLFAPFSGWSAITDQPLQSGAAVMYEDLQTVCKNLMQMSPKGNINALWNFHPATTNAEIREAIVAANGLYWMMCQQIANADRFADLLRTDFPDSKYQFLLDKNANLVRCTNCISGIALVPCTDCGYTGKCRNCRGRGKVAGIVSGGVSLGAGTDIRTFSGPGAPAARPSGLEQGAGAESRTLTARPLSDPQAQQPCPVCGGSGICTSCKGTKLAKGRCPICQGFGSVFTPRTRLAYLDVLDHLRNLAFAAGLAARGMVRMDGRWIDANACAALLRGRGEEHADFARVTAEAERAKDYDTAIQLLERVLGRHPDSIYTADVQRVKALFRAEAADKALPEKSLHAQQQMAGVNSNTRREIGVIIEAVLDASRRGTNMPQIIASQASPVLPAKPMRWQIGEPELIDRTARVPVKIDRSSHTGFPIAEPWEFLLVYENNQWKVCQTAKQ